MTTTEQSTPRELPELPKAREFILMNDHDFKAQKVNAFSAGQMRDYARQAIAESEARAEGDARDAARYRRLKQHFSFSYHRSTNDYLVMQGELKTPDCFFDGEHAELTTDAAIDAAIAQEAEREAGSA